MATIYLLLLVLHVAVYIKASILSFGLNTAGDITLSEVALQLHWGHEIYECSIRPNTSYTPYICFTNASSTQSWSPSGISRQYFIQITNKHADAFDVDSVFVTDDSHNQYTMNEFCVPQSLVSPLLFSKSYLISLNHHIRDICEGVGLVSLNGFGLDSDQHKIVSVMAHFRGNLAHYATTSGYSGYITSSNVYKFGITTAPDSASTEVTLTLHWNLQIIQCTIYPSTSNTEHLCYVNDITTTTCFNRNGYKNMYQLHIDHDDSDTLQIDSIVVYDETYSYYYGIKSFCIDINSSKSGRGSSTDNNCSTPSQFLFFEDICLDNSNCSAHIDVSFGTDVFQNPNSFGKTYGVVTTGVDASGVTCAPTTQPTAEPTMEPTSTPTARTILTEDYVLIYLGHISWVEANDICFNRYNTSLAFIGSNYDNSEAAHVIHLEAVRNDVPLFTYFGLNRFYDVDYWRFAGNLGWSDASYYNWDVAAGEPGSNACAVMAESGLWYTTSCTSQQDVSILCNRHAEIIKDTLSGKYKYVFVGEISWGEANSFCNKHYNTTLATISSAEDNTELTALSAQQYATYAMVKQQESWIGLTDLGSDAEWRWIDNTTPLYYNWMPSIEHSFESCAIASIFGHWDERYCHERYPYPFFCNNPTIANPTPSPTQTPTTLPDMPVNNTAQYTSDMSYIRGWMGVTTWLEANEYCRSQYGTSLATITSAKENTEITYSSGLQYTIGATPTTCSFIGLHRMHSMIDWDWIDGTGLNYTHWASGNTSSDTKLCSFMCGYGTWYTTSCTEEDDHAFVCNSPKHVTTAQPTLPPNTESTVSPDAMLTTFAWNSNETGKGDKKTDNAILIVFVVATCVFAIALCAVSCVCYKRNKLLADAVGVGQVQQETQVMVQRVRADTNDESDEAKTLTIGDDTESTLINR
eukprot:514169_1